MIIEIENPLHHGFYGNSLLNPGEEGNGIEFNHQESDNQELDNYLDDNNICLEYDYENYTRIVTQELNNYFLELINELVYDLFSIEDLFIKKESEQLISPKYYNYSTDQSYIKAQVDPKKLLKFLNLMFREYHDELEAGIIEKHSSYDGFISFYSNDIDEWQDKKGLFDCNELATIFSILISVSDNDPEERFYAIYDICNDAFYNVEHYYEMLQDGEFKKISYNELIPLAAAATRQKEAEALAAKEQTKLIV